jgi:hypothetical protein
MATDVQVPNQTIVTQAVSYNGQLPYKLGASIGETAKGIAADCSSFVQYVFSQNKIDLPRTADQQYLATKTGGGVKSAIDGSSYATGQDVALNNLQPGDLVFLGGWNDPSNLPGYAGIQHVAIYIGNGNIVQEGGGVTNSVNVAPLALYSGHVIAATRVNSVSEISGYSGTVSSNVANTSASVTGGEATGPAIATITTDFNKYVGTSYGDLGNDPSLGPVFKQIQIVLGRSSTDTFTSADAATAAAGIQTEVSTGLNSESPWDTTIRVLGSLPVDARVLIPGIGGLFAANDLFGYATNNANPLSLIDTLGTLATSLANPSNWLHVGAMFIGVGLVGIGIFLAAKDLAPAGTTSAVQNGAMMAAL